MPTDPLLALKDDWTSLVETWARRRGARVLSHQGALTVDTRVGGASGTPLTADFHRSGAAVVVIITDGTLVPPDRLAPTAAAATAWNAREVSPTAVLGYDGTDVPLLSAVSSLPVAAHMTASGFAATLDPLLTRAERLLSECRDLGYVLRRADDMAARKAGR
ncbi:hypothetical protein [Streptomyces sp. JHA26]|uniref:hypothetical protein n=1 Tax=Streptomyces sp. JHA26 TaxID=1917143 RepID=UPI00098A03F5|nr:hypothetical protein [Streptomyces sp. JHA26]